MTLTQEKVKSYISNGCKACPECGDSTRLAMNDPEYNGQKLTVQIDCYSCGKSYKEVYQITTIEPAA